MLKIRPLLIVLGMLLSPAASADVQVSIGIGLPHVSIGINVPAYPRLVVVPGYPVYYAPSMQANFFFYDGMYWVYQDNYWYSSSWYNGPWWVVGPEYVPVFILRVPVRYYSRPPPYFRGWRPDAPPRWGDHWGHDWEQRRSGWDRWDRREAPQPAPRPDYQREYSGDRYPKQVEQQLELHEQKYRYEPREPVVREITKQQRSSARQDEGAGPRSQPSQKDGRDDQKSSPNAPQGRQEPPDRKQPPQREQEPRNQDMRDGRNEPSSPSAPQGRQEAPDRKQSPQRREPEQRNQDMQKESGRQGNQPQERQQMPEQRDAGQQDRQRQQEMQQSAPPPQQGRSDRQQREQQPQAQDPRGQSEQGPQGREEKQSGPASQGKQKPKQDQERGGWERDK